MSRFFLSRFSLLAVAMTVGLAGCLGEYDGGYDKVAFRERTPLAMSAAPEPPAYVALTSGGAAEAPTLPAEGAPAGVTQAMVEEGQQLYGTVCSACHGGGGVGSLAGPILNDPVWIHITGQYEEILGIIQAGVPTPEQYPAMMPPMGGGSFTPEQVRAIGAYIFALSHQPGA